MATQQLAEQVGASKDLPVVPLVIGGDDLTVLIDGRFALAFSREYLSAFDQHAAAQPLLTAVAHAVTGQRSVTACAGVAVVKPHFPFSAAYGLADELCRNAKALAAAHPGTHGLDVHVLLDSTLTDLGAIRAGYLVEHEGECVELTARPYLLAAAPGVSIPDGRDWAEVEPRIRTLRRAPAGLDGGVVTRSQLHLLRGELRTDLAAPNAGSRICTADASPSSTGSCSPQSAPARAGALTTDRPPACSTHSNSPPSPMWRPPRDVPPTAAGGHLPAPDHHDIGLACRRWPRTRRRPRCRGAPRPRAAALRPRHDPDRAAARPDSWSTAPADVVTPAASCLAATP